MMVNTHSQTSNTTCCKRSGNFCTIVTGWPLVKLTPYIGAVVLYLVLHNLAGEPHVSLEENPLPKTKNTPTHMKKIISRYLEFIIIFHIFKTFRIFKEIFNFLAKNLRKKSRKNYLIKKKNLDNEQGGGGSLSNLFTRFTPFLWNSVGSCVRNEWVASVPL